MQAATSEAFIMGIILEEVIRGILQGLLSKEELTLLGFPQTTVIREKLRSFDDIRT